MKSIPCKLLFLVLLLWLCLALAGQQDDSQAKKKSATGTSGAQQQGIAGGVPTGGIIMGGTAYDPEEDFSVSGKKYIKFDIKLLEVLPTSMRLISNPKVITENGKLLTFSQGERTPFKKASGETVFLINYISLDITPTIIEGQGISLQIKMQASVPDINTGTVTTEQWKKEVMTRNLETCTVELMEKADLKSRIVAQITPLIEVRGEAQPLTEKMEIRFIDHLFILNNDRVFHKGGSIGCDSDSGLVFTIEGKGLFMLAFKPFAQGLPIAVAKGRKIRFTLGKDKYEIICRDPIVPEGKWLVWIRNKPDYTKEKAWLGCGPIGQYLKEFEGTKKEE